MGKLSFFRFIADLSRSMHYAEGSAIWSDKLGGKDQENSER